MWILKKNNRILRTGSWELDEMFIDEFILLEDQIKRENDDKYLSLRTIIMENLSIIFKHRMSWIIKKKNHKTPTKTKIRKFSECNKSDSNS